MPRKKIQTYPDIVNAQCYIRNLNIHRDLRIVDGSTEVKRFAAKHRAKLRNHINIYILDQRPFVVVE